MWYLHLASTFVFLFGWEKDDTEKRLIPIRQPDGCDLAPKKVRDLIACECKSDDPCKKGNCSCKKQHLPCSILCECKN